jgi:hypothetical protein
MNISFSRVREMKEQRGPRHLVSGRVEGGVYRARYAATASEAERIADEYENEGLKAIEVYAPGDVDSLIRIAEDLGAERRDIKAQETSSARPVCGCSSKARLRLPLRLRRRWIG